MAHQSLDHDEVLNVRWATADPNPMAQAREARAIEEQAAEAVRRALPAEYVAQIEGRDPEARKRKKIEGTFGLEGYEAPDEVLFARGPNAVNPLSRQGNELEDQQRLMLEGGYAEQHYEEQERYIENGQQGYEQPPQGQQQPPQQESQGIFSSATLAALQSAKGTVSASTAKRPAPAGPLVDYGSDSDSE